MKQSKKNIIVHITKKYESLYSILSENSLRLSFSSENFYYNNKPVSKAAHPMVCFSEFDPRTINLQKITYGSYGIAFSKDWARLNNIGPVLYVSQTSIAAKGMKELLIARRKTGDGMLPSNLRLSIMEVKSFMKNETGPNSSENTKNFDFKAENEWRFIPEKAAIRNYFISQNQRTYKRNKDKHNERLKAFPLKFKSNDIVRIYVADQSEISHLSNTFGLSKKLFAVSKWTEKR